MLYFFAEESTNKLDSTQLNSYTVVQWNAKSYKLIKMQMITKNWAAKHKYVRTTYWIFNHWCLTVFQFINCRLISVIYHFFRLSFFSWKCSSMKLLLLTIALFPKCLTGIVCYLNVNTEGSVPFDCGPSISNCQESRDGKKYLSSSSVMH